ncbi:DNA-binding IclR family transcriptional regulator [Pseudochelatococcus lubricantis]|uniref:DNA-binding IclR family transcriptional regulator n=1 Tax=Pseudochelatococcus lubricantis TaxID=1538102 RepID=A0ABX0V693_9HYPH|nr:IclR family transcriptional regulator [Pseudochelatococcus lubricantis]NIJ60103.1 DNA-binding IclR family transcriptional regulator [Pseudochelatococcus lubricantis]
MREVDRVEYAVRPVPDPAEEDPLFIQAVARALQVLSTFHGASNALTLNEIASRSGIGKSTVQRIVHTLRQQGYMERAPDDRGYVPGIRLLDHTLDYLRLNPVIVRVLPTLVELRRDTGERVDLSLRDDLRLVYALRLQSKRESYFATLIGNSVPLYCTAGGRALLSQLSDDEVDDILARSNRQPFTPRTLTDLKEIRAKVVMARENGYAIAAEEVLQGEVVLGVAVKDNDSRPIGAIHIGGSLSEWDKDSFVSNFAPLAMTAAGKINRA